MQRPISDYTTKIPCAPGLGGVLNIWVRVLEYNVFSTLMFIILAMGSTEHMRAQWFWRRKCHMGHCPHVMQNQWDKFERYGTFFRIILLLEKCIGYTGMFQLYPKYLKKCKTNGLSCNIHKKKTTLFFPLKNLKKKIVFLTYQSLKNKFQHIGAEQNGHEFPYDIFKCIFLNENIWISINDSLKFVPKGRIKNIPALVQIMAWCRSGDKPLSEPMMVMFTATCMRHSASMS